jgi:hypothetical protein
LPRQWWPDYESVRATIENAGPWPSLFPRSNGRFVPLDVDRYGNCAVVLGFGQNHKGKDVLDFDEFECTGAGLWNRLGGGGSGHDLGARENVDIAREALHLRIGGNSGSALFEPSAEFGFVVFLCGLEVASVEVRRQLGVRTANVGTGPGWLAVLWTRDDPAEVVAFAGGGEQTFSWTPPSEAA